MLVAVGIPATVKVVKVNSVKYRKTKIMSSSLLMKEAKQTGRTGRSITEDGEDQPIIEL